MANTVPMLPLTQDLPNTILAPPLMQDLSNKPNTVLTLPLKLKQDLPNKADTILRLPLKVKQDLPNEANTTVRLPPEQDLPNEADTILTLPLKVEQDLPNEANTTQRPPLKQDLPLWSRRENPTDSRHFSSRWRRFWTKFCIFVSRPVLERRVQERVVFVLLETLVGFSWALGSPFDCIRLSDDGSELKTLSIRKAWLELMPAITWAGFFMVIFVFALLLTWPLRCRLPIITIEIVLLIYSSFVSRCRLNPIAVSVGAKKIPALLFTLAAGLGSGLFIAISTVMIATFFVAKRHASEQ